MAAKLKVFGVRYFHHTLPSGVARAVVATTSQKRAAKLIGVSLNEVRNYGCETHNDQEIAIAMSEPHTAFVQISSNNDPKQRYTTMAKLWAPLQKKIMKSK